MDVNIFIWFLNMVRKNICHMSDEMSPSKICLRDFYMTLNVNGLSGRFNEKQETVNQIKLKIIGVGEGEHFVRNVILHLMNT